MKRFVLIAAAALPLLAAAPASACKVIGHSSDGEPLCMTTSDGAGQPYTDGHSGGRGERIIQRRENIEKLKGFFKWTNSLGH